MSTIHLDAAGSIPVPINAVSEFFQEISRNSYSNPHSGSFDSSLRSTLLIEKMRLRVLRFFDADPDEYALVFTSGATAGMKLVAENFLPYNSYSMVDCFIYLISLIFVYIMGLPLGILANILIYRDNHTSALGTLGTFEKRKLRTFIISEIEMDRIFMSKSYFPGLFQGRNRLFIYPAQSNFNGKKYPLDWIFKFKSYYGPGNSFVLLDAAGFASTSRLSLRQYPADFVPFSFYKIFGYPTGLGALIIRKSSCNVLEKTYFGGGTIDAFSSHSFWRVFKHGIDEKWQDGTPDFLGILALDKAMDDFEKRYTSMLHVQSHTAYLRLVARNKLASLKHANGKKVIHFYDQNDEKCEYGPILNFNLLKNDGSFVSCSDFETCAIHMGFVLRVGAFCNPGATHDNLEITEKDLLQRLNTLGKTCSGEFPLMSDGRPSGSIRISFGCYSNMEHIEKFISFLREYFIDDNILENNEQEINASGSIGILENIAVFPIKSCHAYYPKTRWKVMRSGLEYDRMFKLESHGKTLVQKLFPKMTMIKPSINLEDETMILSFPGKESITMQLKDDDIASDVHTWFSNVLDVDCNMVKCNVSENFSNSSPFLLISDTSFESLKEKCVNLNIDSFRANFIIGEMRPFVEDKVKMIEINSIKFSCQTKCKRCAVITINQETGIKTPSIYLNLLKSRKNRSKEDGVYFGRYLELESDTKNSVSIGDEVKFSYY